MKSLRKIIWISQFALSVVTPILLSVFILKWLQNRCILTGAMKAAIIALGIIGGVSGLINSLKIMMKESEKEDKTTPPSYNNHF